jgi:hypothetical protein
MLRVPALQQAGGPFDFPRPTLATLRLLSTRFRFLAFLCPLSEKHHQRFPSPYCPKRDHSPSVQSRIEAWPLVIPFLWQFAQVLALVTIFLFAVVGLPMESTPPACSIPVYAEHSRCCRVMAGEDRAAVWFVFFSFLRPSCSSPSHPASFIKSWLFLFPLSEQHHQGFLLPTVLGEPSLGKREVDTSPLVNPFLRQFARVLARVMYHLVLLGVIGFLTMESTSPACFRTQNAVHWAFIQVPDELVVS